MNAEVFRYVAFICDVLGIEMPRIKTNDHLFRGKTALALCSVEKSEIIVRSSYASDVDLFFSLAHECRHLWQHRRGELSERLQDRPESREDIRAYNLRPEELDANAFAAVCVEFVFGVRPLFLGLDDDIKAKIFKRAAEIKTALSQ